VKVMTQTPSKFYTHKKHTIFVLEHPYEQVEKL
jgi:hypothetical protein